MIKSQKKAGLLIMLTGAAVIIVSIFVKVNAFNDGLLSGAGTALFVLGLARIIKMYRIEKDPDRAADYEASFKDERTAAIAGKAGKYALFISVYIEIAAGFTASIAFENEVLCQALCYAGCFSCILYTIMFVIFNKKM